MGRHFIRNDRIFYYSFMYQRLVTSYGTGIGLSLLLRFLQVVDNFRLVRRDVRLNRKKIIKKPMGAEMEHKYIKRGVRAPELTMYEVGDTLMEQISPS